MAEAEPTTGKKPTHTAYTVREGKGDSKNRWLEVGAAWPHKDGKGFDVVLSALPADGRLVIRLNEPKAAKDSA